MTSSMVLRSPNLADGDAPCVIRLYEAARPLPFKNGGLAKAAQAIRAAGRGGDEVLLHINPQEYAFLKSQWGDPSTNPHTGLPEYGLFKKLKKALKFEVFNVKNIGKDTLSHPQRLLTGAIDPLGTKISNKMFGTNYKPMVNQLGGATEQRFKDAEAQGIDTGTARLLHKAAGAVAGFYGGNALGNLASTGLGNVAEGLQYTADANTLSPVVTSAKYTGDTADFISPVVTQSGQAAATQAGRAAANAAADSNLVGSLAQTGANAAQYGSSALAGLGDKAVDYAKQPKNWATIAKGAGALGLLGGAAGGSGGSTEPGAGPDMPATPGIKQLPYDRTRTGNEQDWYTYGTRPENAFYDANTVPTFVPDEPKPPGKKHGGPLSAASRYVRGAGTGRSDSIDAKLSDGEYVLTAEDVAMLGDGSSDAGAKRLDQFRANLRKHKGAALAKGKISPNAKSPMAYLRGRGK
jgi:hypothetical protein